MRYINNDVGNSSLQGVLEGPTRQANSHKVYLQEQGQSILKQSKEFDHQF